ncbi:endonuclease/exonuclease/phosphatase family protein [Streptomyces sp. A0592]|uniref:endonuclease/exonuclease/phosphatase family protein n=1 Tax=Streptomyces sp. A0592 TaxID=2563099 RepID=UPI001F102EDE|nr:endonuclease/exonuclease/phosphatase family protein [Streptomyces sp. A0592]
MLSTPYRSETTRQEEPSGPPQPRPAGRFRAVPATGRGRLIAAGAVCAALTMALHTWIPNGAFNLGSLFQTFLPWAGLSVPVLLLAAAVGRSRLAAVAVLAPLTAWGCLFGGTLTDKRSERPGSGDFTVVSHNVDEENPDPAGTARALAASGADVLALEEMSSKATPAYERELAAGYPYRSDTLGVRLWSKHPLNGVEAVPIMPWTRAVRATVETPGGPVAVFATHLASVRVTPDAGFTTARRNDAARKLAAAVRAEPLARVVVMGDFNGTAEDSALRPVTSQMASAQHEAGAGFGFTWPARFPMVRIDQILVKGMSVTSAWTLPATGSDHLPVAASLRL